MTCWITYPSVLALLVVAELFYFRVADKLNIIDKPNLRSSHTHIRVLRAALPVVHGGADGDMRGELCG